MSGERINVAIPSLINGVSQQPPSIRLGSQCEEQINFYSSVVDGLRKRPPFEHIAKIHDGQINDAFFHVINRDINERYAVCILDGDLKVFDILNAGAEIPVSFPDGKAYLESTLPRDSFSVVTVADYSFVVNKTVVTLMDPADQGTAEKNEALVFIKKGIVETTYRVMVDNNWFTYLTPSASSTVTSTTKGDQPIYIDASSWTWTQCYNWLNSNSVSFPNDWNIWTWTKQQCFHFLTGISSPGSETNQSTIVNMFDQPDSAIAGMQIPDSSKDTMRAIKANMRNLVRSSSATMPSTISVSSTTSSDTQPSTENIAQGIAEGISAMLGGDFVVEVKDSAVRIYRNDNQDFPFAVSDSWGNEASIGIKREAQKFTDLPARAWDGVIVRITGESLNREDDYYVMYDSNNSTQNGIWREVRGWESPSRLDPSTMPHVLIRQADGTFVFKETEWDEGKVGDYISVPPPSFIGAPIADVCFYRNRLGFIADENIVLSRNGEFSNFWPQTARAVLVTDPIDIAVSHIKVSLLRHAVPFKESLLLFSDQTQFQLTDGGAAALSPETCRVDQTTEIECSQFCKPVGAGSNVYFIIERGDNSAVMEYFVSPDETGDDAQDITNHIPRYIPKGVYKMIASTNEDMIALISADRRNEIWVYKYYWVNTDKAQSSWSRWTFPESDTILSIANIEADMFAIIQRPDGVYLEKAALQTIAPNAGLTFKAQVDRQVMLTGNYDESTNETTWALPYGDSEPLSVILGGAFTGRAGSRLKNTVSSGNTIKATGDFSKGPCIVGRRYASRYVFSEQFIRESRDVGAPAIIHGRLQLRNFTLLHHNSGHFRVEVTAKGRKTVAKEYLGVVGDLDFTVGNPVISSTPFRFGVYAKSDQVKIEIINDQHYPSYFQSAEWIATLTTDARRM